MDFKKRTKTGVQAAAPSFQPGKHGLLVEQPSAAASAFSKYLEFALPFLERAKANCGSQVAADIGDTLSFLVRSKNWDEAGVLRVANYLVEIAENGRDVKAAILPIKLLRNYPRNAKLIAMMLSHSAIFKRDFDFDALSRFFAHFAQEKNSPDFARPFLVGLYNINFPKDCYDPFELYGHAKQYWELLGGTYYAHKIISESLDKLRPLDSKINRIPFQKTGSELVALGGSHIGYLFRIIEKSAFDAWRKAYEAGVPCEQILRFSMLKDGKVRVLTKAQGERAQTFVHKHPKFKEEVYSQMRSILDSLEKLGIDHGDANDSNFLVEMKGKKPHVILIDFDAASFITPPV